MKIDNETRQFILEQSKTVKISDRLGFYRWMIRIYNAK
jgi:hypothetical protein